MLLTILVSNPKGRFILKALQQLFDKFLVVKVEIDFQNVDNDDNVDKVEESQDDRAQKVKYASRLRDLVAV